jgi:hypothetical protein
LSLQPSILGNAIANEDTTLAVGSAITVVIAVMYTASLYGLIKNQKRAPLMVALTSVINRAVAFAHIPD